MSGKMIADGQTVFGLKEFRSLMTFLGTPVDDKVVSVTIRSMRTETAVTRVYRNGRKVISNVMGGFQLYSTEGFRAFADRLGFQRQLRTRNWEFFVAHGQLPIFTQEYVPLTETPDDPDDVDVRPIVRSGSYQNENGV